VVPADTANGPGHACAIEALNTGTPTRALWCWGDNDSGQLAKPLNNTCFDDPQQVLYDDWEEVAAAPGATCGIRTGGTLWCWGRNDAHRLFPHLPLRPEITTPTQLGGAGWKGVRMSATNTCAVRTVDDGSGPENHTYCWGSGATGALGDGLSLSAMPVEVVIPQD
jgi:alpha-tubulin suppressor-like RCC1 family protein